MLAPAIHILITAEAPQASSYTPKAPNPKPFFVVGINPAINDTSRRPHLWGAIDVEQQSAFIR